MRTRAELKSCLKITPPITPDLSAASSPCGSGRTSPSYASDGGSSIGSCGRKTVSFCAEEELEEVFFVDEWDRSPAAVTPKLSYSDILELKQLRISLPYTPPPPTSRQPFTTSSPSTSANKPAFPVSRFAASPSYTPSKWKNRSQSQADLDPEILPYLEAVPIRLLPLLPQAPEPAPIIPPQAHPQTPTPTASPERKPAPPPPSEPPEIRIESPVSPTSPTQRRPNFAFLPLLPIQDPLPVPPPPPSNTSGPIRPKRTLNMTFLPVNAVHESDPVVPSHAGGSSQSDDATVGTTASAPSPSSSSFSPGSDPRSNDAGQHSTSSPELAHSSFSPITSQHSSSSMSPPTLSLSFPLSGSVSGLESDNETDTTDTYVSDTDVESDAPSTSTYGSSLPSPPLDDEDEDEAAVQARLEELKLGTSDFEYEHATHAPRIHTQELGSYFPPIPPSDALPLPIPIPAHAQLADTLSPPRGPGQTPPLSVLYPSPNLQHRPLPHVDTLAITGIPSSHPEPPSVDNAEAQPAVRSSIPGLTSLVTRVGEDSLPSTPLAMSLALKKKIMLEALPSPALVPPSPFELDPFGLAGAFPPPVHSTPIPIPAPHVRLGEAAKSSVVTTPGDSPLLTLETMRAAWDAKARVGLSCAAEAQPAATASALGPSLSRRRSSSS
ncbi:hypothetical protein C2E23DRAFT_341966 [Lenzites betulinus]|nr:hypothetical protein C2E23DRAFT_341966 [Lenzites betulinus]